MSDDPTPSEQEPDLPAGLPDRYYTPEQEADAARVGESWTIDAT